MSERAGLFWCVARSMGAPAAGAAATFVVWRRWRRYLHWDTMQVVAGGAVVVLVWLPNQAGGSTLRSKMGTTSAEESKGAHAGFQGESNGAVSLAFFSFLLIFFLVGDGGSDKGGLGFCI